MIHETVPAALDGQRLDRVVALVAEVSRAQAAALIAAGGVEVDGAPAASGKERLAEGQVVSIDADAVPEVQLPGPDPTVPFGVLYEDSEVVVVDKPAGVVVHPGAGNRAGTLVNGLLSRYPDLAGVGDPMRPGIVHRLDAGTSGALAVARTQHSYELLVAALGRRDVERRYRAMVWGHPAQRHGVIEAPIGRDPRDPLRMAVVIDGRPSRTRYNVETEYVEPSDLAFVECELETGRTHQIRVHLAAIGHPVLGDSHYGPERTTLGLARPFLHAATLAFAHPRGSGEVRVESPLPDDLVDFVATCRQKPAE